jgi:hypothetical protein
MLRQPSSYRWGKTMAVGSDDESDGEEESTSCCRTVIGSQAGCCVWLWRRSSLPSGCMLLRRLTP